MIGTVFVSEGLQKFLLPALRGPGRFAEIGFPAPEFFAYGVGTVEVTCGVLLLLGLYARWAAMPLILVMVGALVTTKLPILLGHSIGPFAVRDLETYGVWAMMHAARVDWAMLLGALVLAIAGAGPRSLDALRKGPMV